ncbi:MAG: hypothetical protein A3J83_02610 [Elusimicrobia bacterium RIFOXYA2_FULL_40_6]|nr:MAG: hypothetical protein A3J83_02610 [Elusimicrobia bacterium RIFOXYA2_FULL_40_6]
MLKYKIALFFLIQTLFIGIITAQVKDESLKDPLIEKISFSFKQDSEKLHSLWYRGYGYMELIKLCLISQKSFTRIDELTTLRDKNEKISKIAEKYKLNYRAIYKESYEIKNSLEKDTTSFIQLNSTETIKTDKKEEPSKK